MAAGGQFGWPKITFDCISRHFRSIRNFYFFCIFSLTKRPFWMTENHFRSHFSPFQINTQLFFFWIFFQNGRRWPAAILDYRKSLSIAFLAISDQYAIFILFLIFFKMAAGGHFGSPISPKNNRVLPLCVINGNAKMKLIGEFMTVENPQAFWAFLYALACGGGGDRVDDGGATKNIISPKFSNFGDIIII